MSREITWAQQKAAKTVGEDKHLPLCTRGTLPVPFLEENKLITETRDEKEIFNHHLSWEGRGC